MSRYVMEWAKEQQPGDVAAKLVLVLLADRTGAGTSCRVYDEPFLAETGLTAEAFTGAVQLLVESGLLTSRTWDWKFKREGDQTLYKLQIPEGWRSRTSGPPSKRDWSWSDAPTAVYRLYDETGRLLYVGIADDPQVRLKDHAAKQPWWKEVATREVVWRETRMDAEREEVIAIAIEYPLYNIHRTTGRARLIDPRLMQTDRRYTV